MSLHVIVGAGPVGTTTARLLAEQGHEVHLVSRSGTAADHPGVRAVAADGSDAAELTRLAHGADALYNCANPPYHKWVTDWPPLAASLLSAAEATGAVLVTMSNLYGYGPLDHPMTEEDPLAATAEKGRVRARMWEDALAAHRAGRVRTTEARASDFFGPGVTGSHLGERVVPRVLAGKPASVIGNPDVPHSWTYVPDAARALVTLATDERAWGRPWHVPTNPPLSSRQAVDAIGRAAGITTTRVKALPGWVLAVGGVAVPILRELREVAYQFDRPFVVDSSAMAATFGLTPTPMDEAVAATVEWYRQRAAAAA